VLGTTAAAGNLVGIAPDEDRETVATVVRDVFGFTVTPLALGPRIQTS
jgi:nitric oxide reductase NorQ protein